MTPKEQYKLAYSAIRYEMPPNPDVEYNIPIEAGGRETWVEVIKIDAHILGIAYKHVIESRYGTDPLSHKESIKNYMLKHFKEGYVYVHYRKAIAR